MKSSSGASSGRFRFPADFSNDVSLCSDARSAGEQRVTSSASPPLLGGVFNEFLAFSFGLLERLELESVCTAAEESSLASSEDKSTIAFNLEFLSFVFPAL